MRARYSRVRIGGWLGIGLVVVVGIGTAGCGRSTPAPEPAAVETRMEESKKEAKLQQSDERDVAAAERAVDGLRDLERPRASNESAQPARPGFGRSPADPHPVPIPANGESRRNLDRTPRAASPAPTADAQRGANAGPGQAPAEGLNRLAEQAGEKGKDDTKGSKTTPSTWKPSGRRPTFARVYVGDGNALELVSLHVTVTVEGPRARTLVDHVFRNPHARQLEGTFEYPLPTGASPSYFAMFLGQTRDTVPPRFGPRGEVPPLPADKLAELPPEQLVRHVNTADWGTLQEARVVSKEKALETYEEIVRGRIDPALLEYASGNTFSGRVFPIPAKGYNRVLIAYEELLPTVQGKTAYRFPLPDCKLAELQVQLHASTADSKEPDFQPEAKLESGGNQVVYSRTWTGQGPGGEAVFNCTPADATVQAISGRAGESGPLYVYARLRPQLKQQAAKPFAQHAVFLLDTSLSEHPDRFGVSMKLLKKILENDPDIKHFNILTFNTGTAWVEPKAWLPNNDEGRETASKRLDGILLEGATDLSAALRELEKPSLPVEPATPRNVFVLSDGQITWGESDLGLLMARFDSRCPSPTRFHCYRTGLGADNAELFEALTRKGGGIFNCFTDADLTTAAQAHRHQCLQIDKVHFAGGPAASDVLVAGRRAALYPGGELIVAGRMAEPGRTQVVIEGTFQGEKVVYEYPLEVRSNGELAARGWGEIAVASLLALNDPKLDRLVTAYCQQFGIGSRVASFLVLENAADYKRLNLEEERGQTVAGDLGKFLDKMWKDMGQALSLTEALDRFLHQVEGRVKLFSGPNGSYVQKLLTMLPATECELPEGAAQGTLLRTAEVPPAYLKARDADRRNVATYIAEARRRADAGDTGGAVRVLSSIIEEHPGRGDALRLVGYRLLDLKQPAAAAWLFSQVQKQRPFEPHSYLDLARSLEACGKYGLAALQYEVVLAGTWHARFHDSLKLVAREDYARMIRQAAEAKALSGDLGNHLGDRLEQMDPSKLQNDLRVSMSWNTDATDIDLWVIEPDGTKCFYSHAKTKNGGELSQDQTQGYGPERYQVKKALKGTYRVIVHYFRANPNLLAGETHVTVAITRHAGTPQEKVERRTVILKKQDEQIEVGSVEF